MSSLYSVPGLAQVRVQIDERGHRRSRPRPSMMRTRMADLRISSVRGARADAGDGTPSLMTTSTTPSSEQAGSSARTP